MGKKKTSFNISMSDVAKLAGVSSMTVSRALRSPELVQPETLERIKKVVDTVGYVPNRIAANLSSDRTTQIALIVPSLGNALYADMIQGISSVLQPQGYQLMVSDSGYSVDLEEKLISAYISHQVCGIVLHNTQHTERTRKALKASGIPCVETGNLQSNPIDMAVGYSNYKAGFAVAQHLLDLGYSRIGFASLEVKNNIRLSERRRGFIAGLKKSGIVLDPSVIVVCEGGLKNGGIALGQILETDPGVQAVFFAGDVLAAGAIFECQRRGINVPVDLAIVASDDNDLMRNIIPSLSTVHFPRYEIGVKSAELILDRINGISPQKKQIDLGFTVIRRQST